MSNYNALKIGENKTIPLEKWNALVEKIETLELKIPDNENGVIINDLTLGTKPGNPNDNTFIDYPWEYETLGVTQKNFNLRLQSPKGVYIHTGITSDEGTSDKWWDKVSLSIRQDGKVGIGTVNPDKQLHLEGDAFIKLKQSDRPVDEWSELNATAAGTLRLYQHNKDGYGGIDILPNGNVGLGITNPQEKLHINGSIRGNGSGAVRIKSLTGWVDVGSKNKDWSHFYTDRSKYYFDREIRVGAGRIGSHNVDLHLCTGGTSRLSISRSNGYVNIGKKPIVFQRYSGIKDNTYKKTNYSSTLWNAAVVGFVADRGDIYEKGTGRIINVRMIAKSGYWHIFADFLTHINHPNWTIDVMFVHKGISKRFGY